MKKIPVKHRLLSRLASLSAAGVLIGSAGIYAADNQNVTGQGKVDAPQFSDVDRNQDQQVIWTEIYAIYDDELSNAGWQERDVMDRYDTDRNQNLDENEYLIFITALAADPSSNLSAASTQQDSSIAGTGQQQQSSAQQQGSNQQMQSQQGQTQQDNSMAGNQQEQDVPGSTELDPGIASTNSQQSGTTQQQDSQEEPGVAVTNQQGSSQTTDSTVPLQDSSASGQQENDSIAGTTGQQDPGTADYYDQESQTSTGGAQSPQQEQGTDEQSLTQTDQSQIGQSQTGQSQSSTDTDQQANQQQEQGQADSVTTTVIAITDIPDITAEDLRDRQVINLGGEEIGEVEDVVLGTDGVISGLVVGVGGFWDIGDKDVFASANELRVSGDQIIWETTLDEDALKELPEYERPEVSSIE